MALVQFVLDAVGGTLAVAAGGVNSDLGERILDGKLISSVSKGSTRNRLGLSLVDKLALSPASVGESFLTLVVHLFTLHPFCTSNLLGCLQGLFDTLGTRGGDCGLCTLPTSIR